MNEPGRYNLKIYQYDTFDPELDFKNADGTAQNLNGLTARMQIREEIDSPTVILELSTDNGRIIIPNDASGTVQFNLPAETTADLPTYNDVAVWVYDLKLIDVVASPEKVIRAVQGVVTVIPSVTR